MLAWAPMRRRVGLAVTLLIAGSAGCKRGTPPGAGPADATPAATVTLDAASTGSGAIFSAPIAAAHLSGGDVIAAGLVVATHSITASRVGADASGQAGWTHPVVPNVAWSADAELLAWPITSGAAIVWRGLVGKKSGHLAVVLAPDGHVIDGPIDVGSFVCATDDGLAWSEAAPNGTTRARLRTYTTTTTTGGSPSVHDDTGPALTEDFTLTCGAGRAFAVVEGDEASPTRVYAIGGGAGATPFATIAPLALGRDEERDLFAWTAGDDLGLTRVSNGGEVQAAEVRGGGVSLLRADKARVAPEDDVVGVDADARQVVLVTTHDASDECPNGRGGASVHALRIARGEGGGGGSATSLQIAPSACNREVGPFWTNTRGRSLVVAWAERASRPEKTSAPITGLAFRVLEEGAATGRVVQTADAIADAGCDAVRCYAVALVREQGSDGMKPEAMKVLAYP